MAPYPVPEELAIGLVLVTETGNPYHIPWSYRSPKMAPDDLRLWELAVSFLNYLWKASHSTQGMQIWKAERWLRDHRATLTQYRKFLVQMGAEQHPIQDTLEGTVSLGERRASLWVFANGIELWSWPARRRMRFREDNEA